MERLGIFVTSDFEGVIDDDIIFLLNNFKPLLSHLAVVCNSKLTKEGRLQLEKITSDIFVLPNSNSDLAAWQYSILNSNLKDYEELILFNDSFFGPFYPAEEIFDSMDKKPEADFWAVTIQSGNKDFSEALHFYFMVIRKHLLHSPEFLYYWKNLDIINKTADIIQAEKNFFTKYFFDKGFSYEVLCDTRPLDERYDLKIDHSILSPELLLKEFHCPFLLKNLFAAERAYFLNDIYGSEPRKCIDFLRKNVYYNLGLIFKNILRKQNIATVKMNLGLDYILPEEKPTFDIQSALKSTVVIAHLYYEDLFAECIGFLCNVPQEISIIITVGEEKKKLKLEKLLKEVGRKAEVRLVSNRGRDISALLVGCADTFKKYKYLCFVHDKKSIRPNESVAVGREFFHLLWHNTLASENFIKNVLATFEKDSYLGILAPPQPYNGGYKILLFDFKYWSGTCYEKTLELAEKLGIPANLISLNYVPLSIGSVFWCRTDALKKITAKEWKVEDFDAEPMPDDGTISHALERIFPFAAQAAGFYSGWLMTQDFAKDELENFIHFANNPRVLPANVAQPAVVSASNFPTPHMLFQYFSKLNNIQILKYFLQSRIPPRLWLFFRPFKNILSKLGFKV